MVDRKTNAEFHGRDEEERPRLLSASMRLPRSWQDLHNLGDEDGCGQHRICWRDRLANLLRHLCVETGKPGRRLIVTINASLVIIIALSAGQLDPLPV
eukprot:3307877-Amphidinium_carterae.1